MKRMLLIAILAPLAAILAVMAPLAAKAEGVGNGGTLLGPLTAGTPNWSGFGVGIYGSWVNAHTDGGSGYPIYVGSEGSVLGGTLSYSVQAGSFVGEVFADYGFFFGDLKDIGAEAEIAAGGKAGILANPSTLLYGLAAKSWVDVEGSDDLIDGWQFGGGVAVKLANTPMFVNLEYRRGLYEVEGVDVDTDTVRLGLTYKFGGSK